MAIIVNGKKVTGSGVAGLSPYNIAVYVSKGLLTPEEYKDITGDTYSAWR